MRIGRLPVPKKVDKDGILFLEEEEKKKIAFHLFIHSFIHSSIHSYQKRHFPPPRSKSAETLDMHRQLTLLAFTLVKSRGAPRSSSSSSLFSALISYS